jgi:prepilin-type N-terminal cleavage/methylation domain-containing protein
MGVSSVKQFFMKQERGFTAIELILVIVILGILAAIAYPRFQGLPGIRVSAAAQEIAGVIRYAQSQAISTAYNYKVYFYASTNSYSVYQVNRSSGAETIISNPLKAGNYPVALNTDYPGVTIGADYTVEFDYLGAPDGGGSVTISGGGTSMTISVLANTGRVTAS